VNGINWGSQLEEVERWLPHKLVDLAYEKGAVNAGDRKFYSSTWGRKSLSPKQYVQKVRINRQIYESMNQGFLSPYGTITKRQTEKFEITPGWDKKARRVRYKTTVLSIALIRRALTRGGYIVRLDKGVWPSDDDLITLCDGATPPKRFHFGGEVEDLSKDHKRIVVYID
jgi:hypothetical protein